MEQATPTVRNLVRLLLAHEAGANRSEPAGGEVNAALSVLVKLRAHLSTLVGIAGFDALLTRALALARTEASWLRAVRVQAGATLEGFSETAQKQPAEAVAEGSAALLAQLLGLLVTFIGEALTLHLVKDIWPEARLDAAKDGHGGDPT